MLVMKFKGAVLQNQETLAEIKNRIKEQNCCSIVVLSLLTFGAIKSYELEISEDKPLLSWGLWILGWPLSLIGLFFLAFNKENILKITEK